MTDKKFLLDVMTDLSLCGVDTYPERRMLGGLGCRILLVAGAQGARVFDLMSALELEPLSLEGAACAVACVYGERFCIQAREERGVTPCFFSAGDFRRYFDGRWEQLRECRVVSPAPLLREAEIRFLELGPETAGRLTELAGDCTAFLLALPCAAGAPGEEMQKLCRWIREERRLPDRAGIVLNHAEAGTVNAMLPLFLREWLGAEAPGWRCGYPASGKQLPPGDVLYAAVQLTAGDTGETDALTARNCVARAREKTRARQDALEREAEECRRGARWLAGVSRSFRSSVENAGAAMHCALSLQQEKALREDIEGMTALLSQRLPGMVQEVVEKNGKQAKDDLKNLAGDYVEALLNAYITALAERICQEEWLPQVRQVFSRAVEEFRSLVKDAPVALETAQEGERAAFLKSLSLNLGNYIDSWALSLGGAVAAVVRTAVRSVLYQFEEIGFLLILLGVGDELANKAGSLAAGAVDAIMPPKQYGKKLAQLLQKNIAKMGPDILDTMKSSMLPAINEHIARQYQDMVDGVCLALQEKETAQEAQARLLLEQAEALERQRQALPAAE